MTAAPQAVVASQFRDAGQQSHAARLGMWVFLASEALVFAVLLTAYASLRWWYPADFAEAGRHLYKWLGVANTALLLLSSAAMAAATERASVSPRTTARLMFTAAALGVAFLAVKGVEYTLDIREHLLPGPLFEPPPFTTPGHAEMFFLFYWIVTALHAVHVAIGVAAVITIAATVRRGRGDPLGLENAVHNAGLYWHFVDVVWLFILPLLYLNP